MPSSASIKKPSRHEPFGARAMMLGLANTDQIERALSIQNVQTERGERKLLGMILVDMGVINTTQLLAILKTYE